MERQIFEDIGLRNSEIDVYLAVLELGETTSGPVIDKSGLQSSVVHRALKSLMQKGLVSFVKVGKNRHYSASDPQSLVNFVEDKKRRIEEQLPELYAHQRGSEEGQAVRMYLGKTAIFRMLDDLIKDGRKGDYYLSFSLIDEHEDEDIIQFYRVHNPRRKQLGLHVRTLVNREAKPIFEAHYTKALLRRANVRFSDFHFPQGLIIFNDIVVMHRWGDSPSAVRIEDADTAKQFRQFFLELYEKEEDAY